jgi:CRP-like cAMP-binding protein
MVLYKPSYRIEHAYFPIDSIIAILQETENGASCEISVVGNEGMTGVAMVLGAESTPSYSIVQSAGYAYRLKRSDLIAELNHNNELRNLLLRYAQSFMTQIAQTAVCNRHHSIDQRLCRLLLQSLDRVEGYSLVMTQELMANMLGVRREGITESAGKLQKLGVISYSRGHIDVLNKDKLEALCCECYVVVKKEENRLFPKALASVA